MSKYMQLYASYMRKYRSGEKDAITDDERAGYNEYQRLYRRRKDRIEKAREYSRRWKMKVDYNKIKRDRRKKARQDKVT